MEVFFNSKRKFKINENFIINILVVVSWNLSLYITYNHRTSFKVNRLIKKYT